MTDVIDRGFLDVCWHGDVVHTRGSSKYGKAIRRALPCWGNHDGTLCKRHGIWGVAEAVMPRGKFTPWDIYQAEIDAGETSVAFLRHVDAGMIDGLAIAKLANEYVDKAPKYDWATIVRIYLNTVFKMNLRRNAEWKWYCTEQVRDNYRRERPTLDAWNKDMPTPYTTEKRLAEGFFEIVLELGDMPFKMPETK